MNITRRSLLSALPLLSAAGFLRAQQEGSPETIARPRSAPPVEEQPPENARPIPELKPRTQGEPRPSFSTGVKLVDVNVTVRDKKGAIVKDLTQGDFAISEDGRPQVIKFFSRENDLPLSLGLLVDTSGSQRNVLDSERAASRQFLWQVLRPNRDLAFVIHFDREIELLQDLTADKQKLSKAIDLCVPSERPQFQQGGGQPGGQQGGQAPNGGGQDPDHGGYPGGGRQRGGGYPGGGRGGGTALYDAIYLACDEVIKKQKGRKALILLTDGVDRGSKYTLSMAVESAQRADTMLYSVLFTDPRGFGARSPVGFGGPRMGRRGGIGLPGGGGYPGGGGGGGGGYPRRGGAGGGANGKKVLRQMADETGGRFFEVSKKLPLDEVYDQIQEELRSQYSIGYTSDGPADAGKLYRKILVTTPARKNLVIRAREGYYAG